MIYIILALISCCGTLCMIVYFQACELNKLRPFYESTRQENIRLRELVQKLTQRIDSASIFNRNIPRPG